MKEFTLHRIYTPVATYGNLFLGDQGICLSLEQPWVEDPGGGTAGEPFASCIPEGEYELQPAIWTSRSGHRLTTFVLVNHDLGVFNEPWERNADWQRYRCKFHVGNFVYQTQGCPMLNSEYHSTEPARLVGSRKAFNRFVDVVGDMNTAHRLLITH